MEVPHHCFRGMVCTCEMEIPLTLFAEWCALANKEKGKQGRRGLGREGDISAALVSPFYPQWRASIPPTSGGGTSTENHGIANNGPSSIFLRNPALKN